MSDNGGRPMGGSSSVPAGGGGVTGGEVNLPGGAMAAPGGMGGQTMMPMAGTAGTPTGGMGGQESSGGDPSNIPNELPRGGVPRSDPSG